MKLLSLLFLILLSVASICANEQQPIYTIVAPSSIKPNSPYHVSFQLQNATQPVQIAAQIVKSISSGNTTINQQLLSTNFTVNPLETKSYNFQIGQLENSDVDVFKLMVQGQSDELNLIHEAILKVESKSFSVFIQTDKAVYKPGQLVQFRVIVVNQNLIPIESSNRSLDIFIRDSQDNLIKQWKRVQTHLGIVSRELQLSEQPPLGDWSIVVDLEGLKHTKTFSIIEYVLPIFGVEIHHPKYVTVARSGLIVTVSATYTYGRPVKGEASVKMIRRNGQGEFLKNYQSIAQIGRGGIQFGHQHTLVNGSVGIPVQITPEDYSSYIPSYQSPYSQDETIQFYAEVQESLTGKVYNATAQLKVYSDEIKIELIKPSATFKPGLKFSAYLKVAYQDDTPVEDSKEAVTIKCDYVDYMRDWNFETLNTLEIVPMRGIVPIELYPNFTKEKVVQHKNSRNQTKSFHETTSRFWTIDRWTNYENHRISFRVEYRGRSYNLGPVDSAKSPSNSFIQISTVKSGVQPNLLIEPSNLFTIGQNVTFQVNSTEPLSNLAYQIMVKGGIVFSGTVTSEHPNDTLVDISIGITRDMAPSARILVYYIREDNREIVADALNFKVDGIFQTPVQLYSSLNQTEPGQLANISVHTNPYAFVGLLGVDQSVLLLKTGNDITREDILKGQESYKSGKKEEESYNSRWYSGYVGPSSTAAKLFDESGLIIFTNAFLKQESPSSFMTYQGPHAESFSGESNDFDSFYDVPGTPFNRIDPKESKPIKPVRLRQKFPETWIWSNVSVGSDGIANYSANIPDSITFYLVWYISAFAMDLNTGLGIAENSLKINVFRPFFIKLSLPYSIIRGETVSIQVLIFNYQSTQVNVEVVMLNEKDEFDFVDISENEIDLIRTEQQQRKQVITIEPFDGVSVYFPITPKILGNIDIKVKAQCANAGDAVVRKLLVKSEGQPQYFNKAMLVKLDTEYANTVKENFSIEIPQNAVPGSCRVQVSGISDILGSTLNHIDDLLRMPYGCGEQNMINLVPNIVVLNYLTRVKRLTPTIKTKALNHISSGYQRELTYRRGDGSFSAFGPQDRASSTWLTAFVLKSFTQARAYIDVDQKVLDGAIEFLFKQQNEDGSFGEKGEVHHKELQGGAASGESSGALTAYVLIAILHESNSTKSKYKDEIKRAEDYIWGRLTNSSDPYEISIIVQALHLADSEHKELAYAKLMTLSKHVDGLVYWPGKSDSRNLDAENLDFGTPNSVKHNPGIPDPLEIETTAYALLTLMSRSDMDNGLPTLRWLISKQNSNGGFASTQDTAIGLQALGSIAEQLDNSKLKMFVSFRTGETSPQVAFEFSTENALVLQQVEIPNPGESKWVELSATGFGSAIVQVSVQYNIAEVTEKSAFNLKQNQTRSNSTNNLQMNICTYYKDGNSTNMAVLEIELPSGYNADLESLGGITQIDGVKRADTANNDGTVYVYFDQITQIETCIPVSADRAHQVANLKPVPITVYDYYDRTKLATIFYEPV